MKSYRSKTKAKQSKFYYAVGRRKESSARVRLYPIKNGEIKYGELEVAKGEIIVNARKISDYFPGESLAKYYLEPFRTTNTMGQFTTIIKVKGGGVSGQLGAVVHGISRALLAVNQERFRPILKKRGFLTRDARVKERRKAGYAQKARAKKQSPKR